MPSPQPRPNADGSGADADIPTEDGVRWWEDSSCPNPPTVIHPDNPSDEYFAAILSDITAAGYVVRLVGGQRKIVGSGMIPKPVLDRLSRYADPFVAYLIRTGQLEPEIKKPDHNKVVEWADGDGFGGLCPSDELDRHDWIRWRYRGGRDWYGANGDSWRV